MYTLRVRSTAQHDIQSIVDYYDSVSLKATDGFLEVLYQKFDTISENPYLFQLKYNETRVGYLQGFPFGVHYLIGEDFVEVLAVLHTSRDPATWKSREV